MTEYLRSECQLIRSHEAYIVIISVRFLFPIEDGFSSQGSQLDSVILCLFSYSVIIRFSQLFIIFKVL